MTGETQFVPPETDVQMPQPKPTLWRLLIEPYKPPSQTESGIHVPDEARESAEYLTIVGRVVDMGQQAFVKEALQDERNPAVGDWVLYGKYAGQRVPMKDGRVFVILNDDDVLAVVDDPRSYQTYY